MADEVRDGSRVDTGGWVREVSQPTYGWFNSTKSAIVEHQVIKPGHLRIQWSRAYNHSSDKFRESVVRRLIRDALGDCRVLSIENSTLDTKIKSQDSLPYCRSWVEAMVSTLRATPLDGTSAIVRAVMASFMLLYKEHGGKLRVLRHSDEPFGPEPLRGDAIALSKSEGLAKGFMVADRDLGRLRLPKQNDEGFELLQSTRQTREAVMEREDEEMRERGG
ncbi:hypothetical protein FZEAL_4455 [Fusarium zealandicum]|uniref:Uncharacterized protein n=1 Tax=Fusarium zealandicum TaxID=1053134 RepID=A0A8H4ULN4_9HYPO|nr:hypothetical protein FZEAL_4455 [Fusarium zealandicum]